MISEVIDMTLLTLLTDLKTFRLIFMKLTTLKTIFLQGKKEVWKSLLQIYRKFLMK